MAGEQINCSNLSFNNKDTHNIGDKMMDTKNIRNFSMLALSALSIGVSSTTHAQSKNLVVAWFGGAWGEGFQTCIADPFTAETGITVTPEIGTSTVTLAKLQQQKDSPTIDVAWIDGGISEMARDAGVVDRLDETRIPNLKNVEDLAVYRKEDAVYAVGTGFFSIGLTYNTDEVNETPTSWKELWNPQYSDLVTIPSPSNSAGVPFIFFLTNVWGGDTENLTPVFDQLKTLKAGLYFDSSGAATNAFQNGETVIGAHYSTGAWEMIDKGLPIGFSVPSEGVWAGDGRLHLVKGTSNKEAAEKFINTALTPEAASCLAQRLYLGPVVKNVEYADDIAHKLPWGENGNIESLMVFDWDVINEERTKISDIWNREIVR